MDAVLFVVIMIAGLAVAAVVIGRAQRAPSPDDPTRPRSDPAADDPRDRPAGPGAEGDGPRTGQLEAGEPSDRPPDPDPDPGAPGGAA